MILRDYQEAAVKFGVDFFRSASRGDRQCIAGPTGSGKSLVELGIRDAIPGVWLITPRLEIARGILQKDGADVSTQAALVRSCWERRVVTPVRLRNALVRGDIPDVPYLLFDEGHHAIASTWEQIQMLCGMPPALLLTATPYRGSPRSTAEFRRQWGDPTWMVTLRQAAARGDVAIPKCMTMPLVDDDVIELNSSGEFEVSSVASAYASRLEDAAERSVRWAEGPFWDRPTVFCLPSVQISLQFAEALRRRGVLAAVVHAGTSRAERDAAFHLLVNRTAALCQVAVVNEGVDLPIRRLVDMSPCMSPVRWMQQLGRCTRPSPEPPEYVCTNRNLMRHAYLLEGLIPTEAIAASQIVFGGPGRRSGHRALGLEVLGKFRAAEVKLQNGCTALLYTLVDESGGRMREYACLSLPHALEPIWAERRHDRKDDGTKDYGRWFKCEQPESLMGFGSISPKPLTDKMKSWWDRAAASRGLDPEQEVNRKNFVALPLLLNLNLRIR